MEAVLFGLILISFNEKCFQYFLNVKCQLLFHMGFWGPKHLKNKLHSLLILGKCKYVDSLFLPFNSLSFRFDQLGTIMALEISLF